MAHFNALKWCHNERDGGSNYQPLDCLLNCWFRRRSTKTSKLRVTSLCVGNSPLTGEFSAQRVSNAENVSIWWRHHAFLPLYCEWKCQTHRKSPKFTKMTTSWYGNAFVREIHHRWMVVSPHKGSVIHGLDGFIALNVLAKVEGSVIWGAVTRMWRHLMTCVRTGLSWNGLRQGQFSCG